jgi:hypothetical protein
VIGSWSYGTDELRGEEVLIWRNSRPFIYPYA